MSRWQEDRDIGVTPKNPHAVDCPTMGAPDKTCICEARVLKRRGKPVAKPDDWCRGCGTALKFGNDHSKCIVSPPTGHTPLPDLALAAALGRVHELEWALTEARQELTRTSEKLAFTQRALDLHIKHCERKMCNCADGKGFICLVHGKANRS